MKLDADAVLWREVDDCDDLLVLLHGVGSHEADLFGLVPELPNVNVASLRAPLPWPNGGRAWFDLGMSASGEFFYDPAQVEQAGRAVVDWLDSLGDRFSRIILVGFSQGAATSLQVATTAPERLTALVMLSGLLPFTDADAVKGPRELPAFIAIGDADEVIGARSVPLEQWVDANLDATVRHYPIGHWVSPQEMADLREFLAQHLS